LTDPGILQDLDFNNDEEERKENLIQRHENMVSGSPNAFTKKKTKKLPPPPPPRNRNSRAKEEEHPTANAVSPVVKPHKDRSQLLNIYSHCLKLCNENKINQKNSWSLDLIDHMNDVLAQQDEDSFQQASCTIDAGVKIYAYRVDSVHSETYKMLGGLSRGDMESGGPDEDEEEADNADDQDGSSEKVANKQLKKSKKAVAINLNSTNTLEAEANLREKASVLSGLSKLTADPIATLHGKSMLRHLALNSQGQLLVDPHSSWAAPPLSLTTSNNDSNTASSDSSAALLRLLRQHTPKNGASAFPLIAHNFEALLADAGLAGPLSQSSAATLADGMVGDSPFAAPLSEADEPTTPSRIIAAFASIPDLQDADDEDEMGAHIVQVAQAQEEALLFSLQDADGEDSGDEKESEKSQDSKDSTSANGLAITNSKKSAALQMTSSTGHWAGLSHWKFHPFRDSVSSTVGSVEGAGAGEKEKKTTKKEKVSFALDFTQALDSKAAGKLKKDGKLENLMIALKEGEENEVTLPEDSHYDVSILRRLFSRQIFVVPGEVVCARSQANANYDYDNARDTENFVPFVNSTHPDDYVSDMMLPDMDDNEDGDETASQQHPAVKAPTTAKQGMVTYARVAKKVDVKALKVNMWHQMEKPLDGDGPVSFAGLVKQMPAVSPAEEAANISMPFCFICLLHLANEKSLKLEGNPQMSELTVNLDH
jgi:condensin complex subunit 2